MNLTIARLDVAIAPADVRVAEAVFNATVGHTLIGDLALSISSSRSLATNLQALGYEVQDLADGGLRITGFSPSKTMMLSEEIWTHNAFRALEPIAAYLSGELLFTEIHLRSQYDGLRDYTHRRFGPGGGTDYLDDAEYVRRRDR